ncbi:protein PLASTID REDOX INSENSITIVE 2, chloroplastic-like [Trifolium pratense]|uniref:protein PLASTID REDOX INSENSITIVE 2, chloroplastic-like n=1 Tax=Trifolium pratense TaxID=57577 RepID=UPI001E694EAA|nr:protein PLASTID REDOX INSENSITIVE 2, chloroplastic-like [Trifolium pratense]
MLLFTSSFLCTPSSSSSSSSSSSIPTVTLSPTNSLSSNVLNLRIPCFILRHYFQCPHSSASSSLFTKPISRTTLTCVLGHSLTNQHVYPDPSPEFAEFETHKFKVELFQKLSDDVDEFGNELDAVIHVCAQIFSEFLHKEYGGPGTLLVTPFTDMLVALKKKKLPGAPLAARASLLWAQNHVDEDWEVWNSK